MSPKDVKKGSAADKIRFTPGRKCVQAVFDEYVQQTQYVLVNPHTQLVCECCFCKVEDITQHVSKKSACGLYMACKHISYCYQENTFSEWRPVPSIVGAMIEDKGNCLTAEAIVGQASSWKPNENFVSSDNCRLGANLTNISFEQLYNNYVQAHNLTNAHLVTDFVHLAASRATSSFNFPAFKKREFDRFVEAMVEERITQMIANGQLQRVQDDEV